MDPFTIFTAVAVPLLRPNIDTDAIIPSREIRAVSKKGLAEGLFAGWRYAQIGSREPAPDFVLNQAAFQRAGILLAGENFGCGSSREHAVWALREYGIRAVLAASFAPIFFGNCVRNGLLPVQLPAAALERLARIVAEDPQQRQVRVDLERQQVSAPGFEPVGFSIDPESRAMLIGGLDAIELTATARQEIDQFLARDRNDRPWIYLN
jgi:3-isopropylmalate/(R)-2-methylmalate dehydratase small subunit